MANICQRIPQEPRKYFRHVAYVTFDSASTFSTVETNPLSLCSKQVICTYPTDAFAFDAAYRSGRVKSRLHSMTGGILTVYAVPLYLYLTYCFETCTFPSVAYRYKFVVDRAKRLLEHWGNVCSLRKDDDVDLGTSTTVISSPSEKKVGESKEGGGMKEEKWVNFAESARRPKQETKTKEENTAGATPAPSCDDLPRSRLTTLGFEEDTLHRKPVREQGVLPDGLENRRNNRETLSLAQLDISSKTVDFPANHMPSVMGTKGHGRKRGRINHFAAGLLPKEISSSKGDPSENHAAGSSPGSGCPTHKPGNISRCNLPPALDPISADEGLPYNGIVESRNSARQTERKSVATSAALAVSRDGANDVTASRTSSCGTINSPGRITAIVRRACTDLSTDHALQPPPPNYGQRVMIPPIGDREFVSYQLPKLRASSADSITDERLRRTPVARFNTANENTRRSTTPNSMPSRHSARVSSGAWPCENAAEYAGIRLGSNGHSNPSPTIRTLSGPRVQRVLAPKSRRSNSDPAANSNVKSTPIVTAPVRGDESQRTKKALPVQHDETRSKNAQDEKIPEDETLESAHSVGGWQDDCSVASAGPPENVTLEPRRPPSDEG